MNEPANSIVAAGHFNKVAAAARMVNEVLKNLPKWMAPSARVAGNYATAEVTREGTIQLTGEVMPADIPALLNWIAEVAELKIAAVRPCGHPMSSKGQSVGPDGTSEVTSDTCQECLYIRRSEDFFRRNMTVTRELQEKTRQLDAAKGHASDLEKAISEADQKINWLEIKLTNERFRTNKQAELKNRYRAKLRLADARFGAKKPKKRTSRRK